MGDWAYCHIWCRGSLFRPPSPESWLKADGWAWDLPIPESLPWVEIREPRSGDVLQLATGLGSGEMAVLALALESGDAVVILDDTLARRHAEVLSLRLTGTLGVLLDAKRAGLIPDVTTLIDDLQVLGFRLSKQTREVVLRLAGEA